MYCINILSTLLLARAVIATPVPSFQPIASPHLNNPTSPAPEPIALSDLGTRTLHPEEVVVYGKDRAEIWQRSVYQSANAELWSHPGHNQSWTHIPTLEDVDTKKYDNKSSLKKRGCGTVSIVYQNPTQTFLDWDQPISPITHNPMSSAMVMVGKSYALAQGVTVTAGGDYKVIKDVFSVSASVAYSHTWTTTDTATLSYWVPMGYYGVVSSNAKTKRYSGTVKTGCVGDYWDEYSFSTDTYTDKSYNGMAWVDGVIGLCASKNYPIPGCIGGQPLS